MCLIYRLLRGHPLREVAEAAMANKLGVMKKEEKVGVC
jgi:hypothetical protein